MNKFLNNESGIALIMVIILVVAVGSLVGVLMTSEVFNISFTGREINETKAFYLAEAGVQRVDYLFSKHGKSIFDDENSLTGEDDEFLNEKQPMSIDSQESSYQITDIQNVESEDLVKIEVLGKHKRTEKKLGITIDLKNDIDLDGLFSNALFASGNPEDDTKPAVSISEGASINGTVFSNVEEFEDIYFDEDGDGKINGDIFVNIDELNNPPDDTWEEDRAYNTDGENAVVWYNGMKYIQNFWTQSDQPDEHSIGLNDEWMRAIPKFNKNDELKYTKKIDYPDAIFPDFPEDLEDKDDFSTPWVEDEEWIIDENGYYENISVTNDRTLTIDMENGDRIIRVDNLDVANGNIELINKSENSKLILYVGNEFEISSTELNSSGKINNLMIYYNGTERLDFDGDTQLIGNLFVNKADLIFTAGSSIKGHVISNGNNVEITGGTNVESRVIYAPEAKVNLHGGGKVKGSIIAKTFNASGGTELNYEDVPFYEDLFEEILDFDNTSGGNGSNNGENKIIWYNK